MKKSTAYLAFMLAALPLAAQAQSYDQCYHILEDGKMDTTIFSQDISRSSYAHLWMCSQNFSESSTNKGLKIKAIYEGITGKGDYSKNTFNQHKASHCNESTTSYSIAKKTHFFSQTVDETVVNAWEKCMGDRNRGLICRAKEMGGDEVEFYTEMQYGPAEDLKGATIKFANLDEAFGDNAFPQSILKEGSKHVFNLKRKDADKAGLIKVTGETTLGDTFCTYRLPVLPEAAVVDLDKIRLENLIAPSQYDTASYDREFSNACTTRVNETLSINAATINPDKTLISVSYQCTRLNHHYNCAGPGSGWSPYTDASYSGNVSASIRVNNGALKILSVTDNKKTEETKCGDTVKEHLESLNNLSLR